MLKKYLITLFFCVTTFGLHSAPLTPEEFSKIGEIGSFRVSPKGTYIAYSVHKKKTDLVVIMALKNNKQTYAFEMGNDKYVGRINWGNDSRLLIRPARKYPGYDQPVLTGALQGINYDGTHNVKLWGYRRDLSKKKNREVGYYSFIESLLRDDPDHIMLTTFKDGTGTKRLVSLDINNGRFSLRERSSAARASFSLDRSGSPIAQFGWLPSNDNELIYKDKEGNWQHIDDANSYGLFGRIDETSLLLSHDVGDNNIVLEKFNRFDGTRQTIVKQKGVEITSVWKNRDGELISYDTNDGRPERHFLNPNSAEAKFHAMLQKRFRGSFTRVVSETIDGKTKIIYVGSDREPGVYLVYRNGKMSLFDKNYEKVDRKKLVSMLPIQFKARDGVEIHGYLSTPKAAPSPVPMVVMVHGGPFGPRDYWGFNFEAQLLASNGYAVLQINFRGSGGYGRKFETSGHRQWGLAMQDDLTDGTRWAIDNGVADPKRICIYGWSYGGYAAIMGVEKEPDLYRCAIGGAGVYDLPLDYSKGDTNDTAAGRSFIEDTIGTDMDVLKQNSPAYRTSSIKAALMLVHGEKDQRVPFEHFERLTKALDRNGLPYEKLVFEGEGHGMANEENRNEFYHKLLKFLKKHIGK